MHYNYRCLDCAGLFRDHEHIYVTIQKQKVINKKRQRGFNNVQFRTFRQTNIFCIFFRAVVSAQPRKPHQRTRASTHEWPHINKVPRRAATWPLFVAVPHVPALCMVRLGSKYSKTVGVQLQIHMFMGRLRLMAVCIVAQRTATAHISATFTAVSPAGMHSRGRPGKLTLVIYIHISWSARV